MDSAAPIVRLQGVSKQFDGKAVLRPLDLAIRNGEFLTLLGPSGCGKTTLLRLIAGFEQADSGSIEIAGQRVNDLPPQQRSVNTVFQSYALFPHMTVYDNVAFGLRMKGASAAEIRSRVEEALQMVQLSEFAARKPQQLSGGQQQRVALARAAVNKPLVLLLDEPLSALDFKLRKQMQLELKQLQRRLGITFIFVTHDQEEALSMSDRVVVMREGEIVQVGIPREVYEKPANLFVARFVGEINQLDGVVRGVEEDGTLLAEVEGIECRLRSDHPLAPGAKIHLLLRPEDMRVAGDDGTPFAGRLRGRVEERTYKGATLDSVIRLESGTRVLASEFFDEEWADFDYRIGEEVRVGWVSSWEVVLPAE